MIELRLVIVAVLVALFAAGRVAYRAWRARIETEQPEHPRLPSHIVDGAERTWVVFTTPFCATCEPVTASLREADPGARVVKIDATVEQGLAEAFSVRAAPTVILADAVGDVQARLVGAGAVQRHLVAAR